MIQFRNVNYWLIVFLIFTGIWACKKKSNSLNILATTPSGFEYTIHKKGEGRAVEYGEVAYFHAIEVIDDSILTGDSYRSGNLRKIPVLRPEENNQYGPLVDVLKELHIGDSITVVFNFDQLRMPPGSPVFGKVQYDIKLMRLTTQRAFKSEQDSLKAVFDFRVQTIQGTAPESEAALMDRIENWDNIDKETTPGGVEYIILDEGDGDLAAVGDTLAIYFIGSLKDKTVFDNSIAAGMPFWFIYGRGGVIPAWDEIFEYIPEGSKAFMKVPFNLAYGVAGSPPKIPESADLFFYVEVGLKDLEELEAMAQ